MKFEQLIKIAFELVRVEQEKSRNHQNLAFYMEHGALVDTKCDLDSRSSLAADDFVNRDYLLGFPVHPVLETNQGTRPPLLTIVNLDHSGCVME